MMQVLFLIWLVGAVLFGGLSSYYLYHHPLAMGAMVLLWPLMLAYMLGALLFASIKNRLEGNQ